MNILAVNNNQIKAVCELEEICMNLPQVPINTTHNFWAGCYARTIMIPAGICITGVQIKIPTLLIVSGEVSIGENKLSGYHILQGEALRKNAFYAHADTWLTMIFATNKTKVADVEDEFTNEPHKLGSRKKGA